MNDFGVVINAATLGRVKGVHVLNEMYMRMAEGPQDWAGQQSSRPPTTFGAHQSQQMPPGPDSSFTSPVPGFPWSGHKHRTNADLARSSVDTIGSPLTSTRSANSELQSSHAAGMATNPITYSLSSSHSTNFTNDADEASLVKSPAASKKSLRNMFSTPKPRIDSFQDDPRRQNVGFQRPDSVSSDGRSLQCSSSGASFVSGVSPEFSSHPQMTTSPRATTTDNRSKKIPFHESPPAEHRKRLNNKPKPKRAVTEDPPASSSRPALTISKSSSRKFSLLGGPKTPKPDYAGFCEGACLMQRGKDGMKLRNQSVSMTGQNNYWSCSNSMCCFEGHAVQKKDENKKTSFGFEEDILEAYGVKYRWSFLAKSHTTIGNSKAGYEFQCAFCIGQGASPFRVKGSKKFIEHVATHQGQTPNQFKMPHFNYIVGRSASNWENFDVNLPAPTAMELETMELPVELEALEPRMPEMEAPLESPAHPMRPKRPSNVYMHNTNGSGLGIRMGPEPKSEPFDDRSRGRKVNLHKVDSSRKTQADRNMDWREDASHHPLSNGSNDTNATDKNEEEETENGAIEQSWTHVRDSIQSLHPAPLFARKPVPTIAVNKGERHQSHELFSGGDQARKPSSRAPSGEDADCSDIKSYNTPVNGAHHALHGQIFGPDPQNTFHTTRSIENRQTSMTLPEVRHKVSTPELSHPGTKWMD